MHLGPWSPEVLHRGEEPRTVLLAARKARFGAESEL